MKFKKPKINLFLNTIPCICLYLVEKFLFKFTPEHFALEMQQHLVHFFIAFVVISRSLRSLCRILMKNEKIKKVKSGKKVKKLKAVMSAEKSIEQIVPALPL